MSSSIERLRAAHHLALRAQHTASSDAAALVRTWPLVASAAYAALHSIPDSRQPANRIIERIALDARSFGQSIRGQQWPGPGKFDPALMQVAKAFEHASVAGTRRLSSADTDEAIGAVVSSLWTTSQLVGRAGRDQAFDLRNAQDDLRGELVDVSKVVVNTTRRFNAIEQLAAGALWHRPSSGNIDAASLLTHAVAAWDIEAHRALLTNRSTAVLHVLAHLEAVSASSVDLFVAQMTDQHVLDVSIAERLHPIVTNSADAWADVRDIAAELSFGHTAVPATLIDAATDLRDSLKAALTFADTVDQVELVGAFSSHLASAVTISAASRDLIANGELRAPARALARLSSERSPDAVASQVNPVAIHRGLSIPLTKEAIDVLDTAAASAFVNSVEVLDRAAGLDTFYRTSEPPLTPQARPIGPIVARSRPTTQGLSGCQREAIPR